MAEPSGIDKNPAGVTPQGVKNPPPTNKSDHRVLTAKEGVQEPDENQNETVTPGSGGYAIAPGAAGS